MGGKPRIKRIAKHPKTPRRAKQVRSINRQLLLLDKEKKRKGLKQERSVLVDEKERLLNEMYAACVHPEVVQNEKTGGRTCLACGYAPAMFDAVGEADFSAPATRTLENSAYQLEVGRALVRLGINISR